MALGTNNDYVSYHSIPAWNEKRYNNGAGCFGTTPSLVSFCRENRIASRLPFQKRNFSKRATEHEKFNGGATESSRFLSNEKLMVALMRQHSGRSIDSVQVRLVMDKQQQQQQQQELGSGQKRPGKTAQIVSLSEAIRIAAEMDLDLVEISLDQPVPVVKAVKISRLHYQAEKAQAASSKTALPLKEFQLKVGIERHDLQRQVDRIAEFLEKGHKCQVRIRCPGWMVQKDPHRLATFLDDVIVMLSEVGGESASTPDFNETRTQVKLTFQKKK